MTAPDPLREYLESARGYVTRASWIDRGVFAENALTMLASGRAFVASAPNLDRAYEEAVARISEFRDELAARGLRNQGSNAVENARSLALLAIEQLTDAWSEASPSDEAKALGYDWWTV